MTTKDATGASAMEFKLKTWEPKIEPGSADHHFATMERGRVMGASVPKRPTPRARARADTKQKAVEMLIAGTPVGDVAKALGVDRRTVHRWSKSGGVARQIEESIAAAVERGRGRLLALVDLSVVVVRECLDCSAESKADASAMRVRLEAAKLVFDRVGLCAKQEVEVTNQSLVNLVEKFGGA